LKSKLSDFDSLNSGDGLKIREHRRVDGEERNKSPMVLGQEMAGIENDFWCFWPEKGGSDRGFSVVLGVGGDRV
jgi:hypothetical protein